MSRRLLLVGTAALLYVIAFPPYALGAVGFVALVPFHFAVRGQTVRAGAALGLLFGLATNLVLFRWLLRADVVRVHHLLIFAAHLALYPAVLGAAWAKLADRKSALVFVPSLAVALDWVRGHAGFLACPWLTIGQTQHANLPLLQLASVGGEPLVAFLVVAVNVALAQIVSREVRLRTSAGLILGIVAGAHLLGWKLLTSGEGRELRIAVVQPYLGPSVPPSDRFSRLDRLTQEASASSPDLIVWPESAAGDIDGDPLALLQVRALVDRGGIPTLFGSSNVRRGEVGYNSLAFMRPGEPMPEPYRKRHLIAFAEYVPRGIPLWFGPRLFETIAGTVPRTFDLGGVAVVPIICVESIFADEVRESAPSAASVIAVAVNDAWFGDSAAAEMHNVVSVFRAVENRRPVAIASNGGPSEIIDAHGRVLSRTRRLTMATVSARVRVDAPQGIFQRWGARPFFLSLAIPNAILALVIWARRTRRGPRGARPN